MMTRKILILRNEDLIRTRTIRIFQKNAFIAKNDVNSSLLLFIMCERA